MGILQRRQRVIGRGIFNEAGNAGTTFIFADPESGQVPAVEPGHRGTYHISLFQIIAVVNFNQTVHAQLMRQR